MSEKVQVVAAIIERSGRFLFGKRSPHRLSAPGYWCTVTGRIEAGEVIYEGPNVMMGYATTREELELGDELGGVLRTPGALVLGEISFGTYLLHGVVVWSLFTGFGRLPLVLAFPLAAVATVVLASFAHLLIERPGIRIGATLAKKWTHRSALRPALQGAP